jgi:hypothetical protein
MNPESKADETAESGPDGSGPGVYRPVPADTSGVAVTKDILDLTELLARNTHENWAHQRISDGWRWGPGRDDEKKEHPCLVAYDDLPEQEKEYDRRTALETVRLMLALGYRIVSP